MSHTAESLDEIAAWFEEQAEVIHAAATKTTYPPMSSELNGEARAWIEAAHILRRTTLTRDMQ